MAVNKMRPCGERDDDDEMQIQFLGEGKTRPVEQCAHVCERKKQPNSATKHNDMI